MATEVKHNNRSIYNILDLLGDIGGLADMLRLIAEILIQISTVIFGSSLDQYLL